MTAFLDLQPGLRARLWAHLLQNAIEQVALVCPDPDPAWTVLADTRLLRTALECLLRNAIEAAPAGGWAGVRVAVPEPLTGCWREWPPAAQRTSV